MITFKIVLFVWMVILLVYMGLSVWIYSDSNTDEKTKKLMVSDFVYASFLILFALGALFMKKKKKNLSLFYSFLVTFIQIILIVAIMLLVYIYLEEEYGNNNEQVQGIIIFGLVVLNLILVGISMYSLQKIRKRN